ncbi:MAG: hypothetical protein N2035_07100 [Chthoniobacterales bacterium]|nr:hypothetical protein [Chthoniobacterales bacterium]
MKIKKISSPVLFSISLFFAACFSVAILNAQNSPPDENLIPPAPVEQIQKEVILIEEINQTPTPPSPSNSPSPTPTPSSKSPDSSNESPHTENQATQTSQNPQSLLEIEINQENQEISPAEPRDEDYLPPPSELTDDQIPEEETTTTIQAQPSPTPVPPPPTQPMLARYRDLRIKTEKIPTVAELRKKAERAKTLEDYRAAMRAYYRELFRRMRKADPSLKPRIDAMEKAYLENLAQTRIEPTIPLSPPPTPEPLE